MKLHVNKELFQDAILAASQSFNIPEIYIEKDYWVTLALYKIFHSYMKGQAVFKGGTALSKCHKLIERFSEDIDVVVIRNEGEKNNLLKKKIRNISKIVENVMPEIEIEGLTNKMGNIRKTVHQYDKLFDGDFGQVSEHIVLEATWLGNFEPFTNEVVSCYVTDMMKDKDQNDLIEQYNMQPFSLQVLSKERTFCEKIMSLVRFSKTKEPYVNLANKIRHLYDIHLMLKNPEIKTFFDSHEFDKMLIKVGKDDLVSYKNNNDWLAEHPSKALVYAKPYETWDKIKTTYHSAFKDLVTGELPEEDDIVTTLKKVSNRLKLIEWEI